MTLTQWRPLLLHILVVLSFLTHSRTCALTLNSGQRILPRKAATIPTLSPPVSIVGQPQPSSIFDLPLVEKWASERGLKEHHLKKIYHVVMHSSSGITDGINLNNFDLEERLLQADFPRKHAAALATDFTVCTSRLVETRSSASGGQKLVVQLPSGLLVETVLIRHDRSASNDDESSSSSRYTVCVSSQVGCAKACSFCATGTLGLLANLSSAEILEQVYLAKHLLQNEQQSQHLIRNVVFMGMGEPLDNYDAVHESCRGLTHQCLFGLKSKHVTISTVGDTPRFIRKLADEAPQISLALSLHGATQELRSQLVKSAKHATVQELAEALDYHSEKSGRGAMLEYLLIHGVNDGEDALEPLVQFCLDRSTASGGGNTGKRRLAPFVNLIPYNPTLAGDSFGYTTPSDERIEAFHARLRREGVKSLVRWSSAMGRDAEGACGQLALSVGGS